MAKTLETILSIVAILTLFSCSKDNSNGRCKTLVVYYSQTGNTKQLAQMIASSIGADMDSIIPKNPYTGTRKQISARCKDEIDNDVLPEISFTRDAADYDTIFIGSPIWNGTFARPLATWIDEMSLSGKVIVPFCTYGRGDKYWYFENMKKAITRWATIFDGIGIIDKYLPKANKMLERELLVRGIKGGKKKQIKWFFGGGDLTKKTRAIYDSAIVAYPEISEIPFIYTKREIEKGVEYMFGLLPIEEPTGEHIEPDIYVVDYDDDVPVVTEITANAWDRNGSPIAVNNDFLKAHKLFEEILIDE